MYWANFLHFYQPPDQKREIVDAIAAQTYNPIFDGILASAKGGTTVNMAGSLLELLDRYGHQELLEKFREAGRRGLVEYVGSSKYHAILPLLRPAEARRQIIINDEANQHYLGDAYNRRGFFCPEMAYDPKLAPLIEDLGFEWVLLDELAYNGKIGTVDYTQTYQIEGTKLKAFFREHRLSDTLMAASTHTVDEMSEAIGPDILQGNRYLITGLDGETFGHHRVGHERLLLNLLADPSMNMVTISTLLEKFPDSETVKTVACSWASNEADLEDGIPYITWDDPTNELHELQWELADLVSDEIAKLPQDHPDYPRLRSEMDPALSSDPFFWSAARPWWMIEHIERGAHMLLQVLDQLPTSSKSTKERGRDIYNRIMAMAWDWQRNGRIDFGAEERAELLRIPFIDRTKGQGGEGEAVWEAFMHLFDEREKRAAERRNYEAAELWRNAKYKLDQRLDIYDAFHVIDMLRAHLPSTMVEEELARYRDQYNHIRGGQSEQRSH